MQGEKDWTPTQECFERLLKAGAHIEDLRTLALRYGLNWRKQSVSDDRYRMIHERMAEGMDHSLTTEIVSRDDECVVMKATISNADGRVLATGHSEEYRHTSQINRTSALENAETSAIGRALAALGIGGTEFASADEVANAITQQHNAKGVPLGKGVHKPTDGAWDRVAPERKHIIADTASMVLDALNDERDFDAYSLCESLKDADEKVALWTMFDSKQRSRLKAQAAASKEKVANG